MFLAVLVANMRELIVWNRNLSLFSNAYEFSMIIVPSIIIAPRYFSGEVITDNLVSCNSKFNNSS